MAIDDCRSPLGNGLDMELTFVGLAIGPVFLGVMGLQTNVVAMCEVRNTRAREEVARVYHEASCIVAS